MTTAKPKSTIPTKSKSSTLLSRRAKLLTPQSIIFMIGFVIFASIVLYKTFAANPTILAVAKTQLSVHENPDGCNCGGAINTYTANHPEPWCADFVSFVYFWAGKPFTGGTDGGWRINTVVGIQAWFQAHGTWHFRGDGDVPQTGDAVRFNWDGYPHDTNNHIGIVDHVSGSTLYTVEGNTSNGVYARSYSNYMNNAVIIGWGRNGGTSGGGGGTNPYSCPTHPQIARGSSGSCVQHLQWYLNHKANAGLVEDGAFGPLTDAAVRGWQAAHVPPADGIVGPKTWTSLINAPITNVLMTSPLKADGPTSISGLPIAQQIYEEASQL